jgi:hypothetical protein
VTIFNTLLFFVRRGLVIASARAEFPADGGQPSDYDSEIVTAGSIGEQWRRSSSDAERLRHATA